MQISDGGVRRGAPLREQGISGEFKDIPAMRNDFIDDGFEVRVDDLLCCGVNVSLVGMGETGTDERVGLDVRMW